MSKICAICNVDKPSEDYTKCSSTKDGLNYYCRECQNVKNRKWKSENKDKLKAYRQKNNIQYRLDANKRNCKKFGWTPPNFGVDVVQQAIEDQKGICAACLQPFGENGFYVDHDHTTGNFRGLLCYRCNTAEGFLKTSEVCLLMATYLKKFEAW